MMDRGQFKQSCMGNPLPEASYYKSIFRGMLHISLLQEERSCNRGLAYLLSLLMDRVRVLWTDAAD